MSNNTVQQLIEYLQQFPSDANVKILTVSAGGYTTDVRFDDLILDPENVSTQFSLRTHPVSQKSIVYIGSEY